MKLILKASITREKIIQIGTLAHTGLIERQRQNAVNLLEAIANSRTIDPALSAFAKCMYLV